MENARTLLDCIPALRHPCDLDLLVFFARHSQALISSDYLAQLIGYPMKEIARSRDALLAAEIVTRTQDASRPERLYMFAPTGTARSPLKAIVEFAATRDGRLALRRALAAEPAGRTSRDTAPDES